MRPEPLTLRRRRVMKAGDAAHARVLQIEPRAGTARRYRPVHTVISPVWGIGCRV